MTKERVEDQLLFLTEADRLKSVERRSVISDQTRRESSADHSWYLGLAVYLFSEYAPKGIHVKTRSFAHAVGGVAGHVSRIRRVAEARPKGALNFAGQVWRVAEVPFEWLARLSK